MTGLSIEWSKDCDDLKKLLLERVDIAEINRLAWEDVQAVQRQMVISERANMLPNSNDHDGTTITPNVFRNKGGGIRVKLLLASRSEKVLSHVRIMLSRRSNSVIEKILWANTFGQFGARFIYVQIIDSEQKHYLDNGLHLWQSDEWKHLREVALLEPYQEYQYYLDTELDKIEQRWRSGTLWGLNILAGILIIQANYRSNTIIEYRLDKVPDAKRKWYALLVQEGLADTTGLWIGGHGNNNKLIAAWDALITALGVADFATDADLSRALKEYFPLIYAPERINGIRESQVYADRLEQYLGDLRTL